MPSYILPLYFSFLLRNYKSQRCQSSNFAKMAFGSENITVRIDFRNSLLPGDPWSLTLGVQA